MQGKFVFETTKERMDEAAKVCPALGDAMKIMFPDQFKPKCQYFRAGSIFLIRPEYFTDPITTDPDGQGRNGAIMRSKGTFLLEPSHYHRQLSSKDLVLLMHEKGAHEYRLIHLATGYAWFPKKTYYRKSQGIEIPTEDLYYLKYLFEGSGK